MDNEQTRSKYESTKCEDADLEGFNEEPTASRPAKLILIGDERVWKNKNGESLIEIGSYSLIEEKSSTDDNPNITLNESHEFNETAWTNYYVARNYTVEDIPDESMWTAVADDTLRSDGPPNVTVSFTFNETTWTATNGEENHTVSHIDETSLWSGEDK
jgi:hypothetical protein